MSLRVSGINLPDQKSISVALTAIFGIGRSASGQILNKVNIDPHTKTRDLTSTEGQRLRDHIESNWSVEGELKREISRNIKHLKDTNTYRGIRHTKNLPTRGQRTRTNSRTVRGNVRRTAGSGRKSTSEKT